jgi:AraC-like DNA-binding protein
MSPGTADQPASTPEPGATLPLEDRLKLREQFFRQAGIDPRQFLQAFDQIPGLDYFVKDVHSRTMLNTRKFGPRSGFGSEEQFVGRRAGEYLAKGLAEHYEADDQQVIRTGQPLRNIIEFMFDELGVPDWIITDKYPLRDAAGSIVGIMGTMQSFEGRIRALPHLGDVGVAAQYIRENLARRMPLGDVAAHVGISERHLQRLFRHAIGMSVQQFIIRSRVHAAAHHLTRATRPLAEIALDCGFSDQSAFTNTFRRIIGQAPREYRKRFLRDFTP